jgi:hypothetical protein
MAGKEVVEEVESQVAGYDPEAFDWDIQHEESPDQILFTKIGDEYVGLLLGHEVIGFEDKKGDHQEFTQWRFRDPGGITVINGGYELNTELAKVPLESMVRIRLMKLVDVGQNDPMKSYRIWTARRATGSQD